jgi:hypothetical protein
MTMNDPFASLEAKRISEAAAFLRAHPEFCNGSDTPSSNGASSAGTDNNSGADRNWPDPPAVPAFHGLAGDFVRAIDPYSEADPAAILLQFLTAFGSVVGSSPRFMVGATPHHLNEFVLIVGRTAKSRKGTSLGEVRAALAAVDDGWARSRVLPGLSSGEGVIYHVRDEHWGRNKKGEQELIDEGVTDKRLLVLEAEFASALRVMQREGNTLSPVLRCAWDALPLGTLTKNSPQRAARKLAHFNHRPHYF